MCSEWLAQNVVRYTNYSQICHNKPAYRLGPKIFPTCGMECESKLQAAQGLPNLNKSRISDPSNSAFMSSVPPNLFDNHSESPTGRRPSEQTYAKISRYNQIGMCKASIFLFMISTPSEIVDRMLGMSCPPTISEWRQNLPYLWTKLCC